MTTEEAKKAGFHPTNMTGLVMAWDLMGGNTVIHRDRFVAGLDADCFPNRAKAREALRKRKAEAAAKPSETPAEKDARIKALVDGYKAKAEAEPLEWCERKVGEPSEKSDDRTVSSTVDLQAPLLGCLGTNGKDGNRICGSDGWVFPRFGGWDEPLPAGGRARYRNPLWLAKHGKSVASHETPSGETQPDLKLTGETQSTSPTTIPGWLMTIPVPAIRDAALRQYDPSLFPNAGDPGSLHHAILFAFRWDHSVEGNDFWDWCAHAADGDEPWPAYPEKVKAKQDIERATGLPAEHIRKVASARRAVEDGWTPHEVGKAAFKPDAVSHPSHYTSHPSGVECITITKHMNFCRGNAMKYLWRAGQKGDSLDKEIEDIAKAEEYCRIEKERLIATKGAK